MTENDKTKNKKIKTLLLELNTKDENKQVAAVKSLKIHGDETVIRPLVQILTKTKSENLKQEITDLLNTTKSTKVPAEIAACLMEDEFKPSHQALLVSIWSSGLDYRPYLKEIISSTIQGGLMEAVECITILENIEGGFTEEEIFEPQLVLKEYLVANQNVTDSRMDILHEISGILSQINNNL